MNRSSRLPCVVLAAEWASRANVRAASVNVCAKSTVADGARPTRTRRAFTLLEVIITISLATALIGAAIGFYQYAGSIRNTAVQEVEAVSARRQIMDRLTADLRGAVALPLSGPSMQGTSDRIVFLTATLPGKAAWAIRNATEDPIPPEQDLRQVTYGLQTWEDEQGAIHVSGFETQTQKLILAPIVEEGEQITTTLLSPQYLFVRFQYWDGSQWLPEWVDQPTLPLAIDVSLGIEPLAEGTDPLDYPEPVVRRVIYLPAGQPAQPQQGGIQGLSGGLP